MDDATDNRVLDALVRELSAQGHGGNANGGSSRLEAYPIKGTIDVRALAEAVENALGGVTSEDDGKTPAELNAANDG
jgi:hypothetical protein